MSAWRMKASALARRRPRTATSTFPRSCRPRRSLGRMRFTPATAFCRRMPAFADMVDAHGLTFIGPSADHISMMGDKIAAKTAMAAVGVPLVPGSDGEVSDLETAPVGRRAHRLPGADQGRSRRRRPGHEGRPRAGGTGGGVSAGPHRSTRRFRQRLSLHGKVSRQARAISSCRSWPTTTATSCISASATAACNAGIKSCWRKRDRRRSATPSATRLGETATAALRKLGYRNAGTLEFLYQDGHFAFIEMNTRLQVEHPVTEMLCDVDLVREQIRVAARRPAWLLPARHRF